MGAGRWRPPNTCSQSFILPGLHALLGIDVRPILYLDLALFVVLAAGLIWAARRVRGVTSFTDAFFPILPPDHRSGGGAHVGLQTYVYGRHQHVSGGSVPDHPDGVRGRGSYPTCTLAAGSLPDVLLPLTYGGGVAVCTFLLGLWMAYTGYQFAQVERPPWTGGPGTSASCQRSAALLGRRRLCDRVSQASHRLSDDRRDVGSGSAPVEVLKTILKFLAMSLGPAARARPAYPFSAI